MPRASELIRAGRYAELAALLSEAAPADDPMLLLERTEAAWELGLGERARSDEDAARRLLVRSGDAAPLARAYAWLARIEAAYGDPAKCAVPIEKARRILESEGSAGDRLLLAAARAEWLCTARDAGAVEAADALLALPDIDAWWRAWGLHLRALLALDAHDADAAARAIEALRTLPADVLACPDIAWRVDALLAGSDPEAARRGTARLAELLGRLPADVRSAFPRRRDRARLLRRLDDAAPRASTRMARDFRRLSRVIRAMNSEPDVSALLRLIVDSMVEATGAGSGLLCMLEDGRVDLAVRRGAGGVDLPAEAARLSLGIAREVASTGRTRCLDDASADAAWGGAGSVAEKGLRSVLCVPLRFRDRRMGSVFLEVADRASAFGSDDVEVAEVLADQAAVAIENAFLLARAMTGAPTGASTVANLERRPAEEVSRAAPPSEGAEQEVDELLLSRFGRDVVTLLTQVLEGGDDLEGVLKRALAATVRVTGAERGFILLFEGKDQVRVRSAFNLREEEFSPERFRLSFGVIEHLVRKGKPVRASNVAGDERFQGFQSVQDISLASFVAVPVPGKAGPQGVIYVDSTSQKKSFTPEDEVLLVRFADFLARALGMAVASQRRVLELAQLQQALAAGMKDLAAQYRFEALIGEGPAIRKVRTMLDHVVRFPYPVLVIGETGTGKELVAKAIHANSPRKDRPLVAVNCAALPRELLESELFGHVKGAFTGADRDRPGLFKSAHQGTLFLDEIGETSEELQRKLLRVLQEGEYTPVGATAPQRCDVRIVAATNRDLEAEVREGRFREDLYFRLKVFKVVLPPLRERPEDVPLLARFLLDKAIAESGAGAREIHAEAVAALGRYAWPGNVRELENAMRHAVAFSHDVIRAEHLPPEVVEAPRAQVARGVAAGVTPVAGGKPADEMWKALIERTLEETAWNQSAAAKVLGITRTTLRNKIRGYGIERR